MNSERKKMIQEHLIARGIHSKKLLDTMNSISRENFIPEEYSNEAYADAPIPIGYGQTISQPLIVAMMIEAIELKDTDTVLEIGCGSGYNAAIMANLCKKVYSMELIPQLAQQASKILKEYKNVQVIQGDGYLGLPQSAPFDKIILTAAPETIPTTLIEQLAVGGTMIAPVGEVGSGQKLIRIRKDKHGIKQDFICNVRFVPMTSE